MLLQYFKHLDDVRLTRHGQVLDRAHGGFRGGCGQPDSVMLGNNGPVGSRRLGGTKDGAEVAGILNLVQGEEKCGFATLTGNSKNIVYRSILRSGDSCHDTLVVRCSRDGRELIARAVRDLDPRALGQAEELLQRGPSPLGEDGDLFDPPALGAEQFQHRIAAKERSVRGLGRIHWAIVHVVPSRESLSVTLRATSSVRSRSASAKSRCLRACSRR